MVDCCDPKVRRSLTGSDPAGIGSRWWLSLALLPVLVGAGLSATAGPRSPAPLVSIHDAWIRWLPAGVPAGGYLTLRNDGDSAAVLTGASSREYSEISLHRSVTRDGVAAMEPVTQIVIPPHQSLRFAAGGYHLMLSQPTRAILPGDQVHIEFHFSDGSSAEAAFAVRRPDAVSGSP